MWRTRTGSAGESRGTRAISGGAILILALSAAGVAAWGCRDRGADTPRSVRTAGDERAAECLGNLRAGRAPTRTETEISNFLFGAEPEPPLALVKPVDVDAQSGGILVCDPALGGVVRWRAEPPLFDAVALTDRPRNPALVATTPQGDLLVGDSAGAAVYRYAPDGALRMRYVARAGEPPLRPGGLAVVGDTLWVSNTAAHRIEVFSLSGGEHQRSIGRRGNGPGEFGFPLGIAVTPRGEVLVVDMLGCRVQVLDASGRWLRDLGGPGDQAGRFAQPKDVAVGPDGVIFVSDSASQRVTAFDAGGGVLGVFGGPDSGADALALPGGIGVARGPLATDRASSSTGPADYYVLVAEQMARPGVRVFAWYAPALARAASSQAVAHAPDAHGDNPHWRGDACAQCHEQRDGAILPIAVQAVDALCLTCHDGTRASREPHPIGRPAVSSRTTAPGGWPLVEGRLGCVTCHDFDQHCRPETSRPAVNAYFLREGDALSGAAFCAKCHTGGDTVLNPHKVAQVAATGAQTCIFCHTRVPNIADDGTRHGEALLRNDVTQVCLGCHKPHADPSPRGHLGAALTETVRPEGAVQALLPVEAGRVTCATCHNPHPPGLFPPGSAQEARSADAADANLNLRLQRAALCLACHPK